MAMVLVLAGCGGGPGGQAERTAGGAPPPAVERGTKAAAGELPADEARAFLATHPEALVLDVRNPDEWNDDLGHIEGARQIPLPDLSSRMGEIEGWKENPIVVVCRVGGRSRTAAELLRSSGYRQALNLEGGMVAWRQSAKAGGR
jgi:rhodanese-related sulfurtransferase